MCHGQGLDVEASLVWLLGVGSDLDGGELVQSCKGERMGWGVCYMSTSGR